MRGLRGDGGQQLHPGRTVADHRDPLACQVQSFGPGGRVNDLPAKLLDPINIGQLRIGEGSAGRDDDIGLYPFITLRGRDIHCPDVACLVKGRALHGMVEAAVGHHPIFARHMLQIVAHRFATVEIFGPWVELFKAIFIGDGRCIDAHIGIAVDGPGAPSLPLAFQQDVGDAQQFHLHARDDPRRAAADDDDAEIIGDGRPFARPFDGTGKGPECRQIAPRLELQIGHFLPGGHRHERAQIVLRRFGQHRRASIVRQPGYGPIDQQRFLRGGHLPDRGQCGDLRVTAVVIQRDPHRVQISDLYRTPDEIGVGCLRRRGHDASLLSLKRLNTPPLLFSR